VNPHHSFVYTLFMGGKPVANSLVCALIPSVRTSINVDLGFTRV